MVTTSVVRYAEACAASEGGGGDAGASEEEPAAGRQAGGWQRWGRNARSSRYQSVAPAARGLRGRGPGRRGRRGWSDTCAPSPSPPGGGRARQRRRECRAAVGRRSAAAESTHLQLGAHGGRHGLVLLPLRRRLLLLHRSDWRRSGGGRRRREPPWRPWGCPERLLPLRPASSEQQARGRDCRQRSKGGRAARGGSGVCLCALLGPRLLGGWQCTNDLRTEREAALTWGSERQRMHRRRSAA